MDKINEIKKFEEDKKHIEAKNRKEMLGFLTSKFSEKLSENPVIIYTQHENEKPGESFRNLNTVKSVRSDESGTGGDVGMEFNDGHQYLLVGKNGVSTDSTLHPNADYYKITKDSYHTLLTAMNELIEISGYSEKEKAKMFQDVIDNFKNKIVKD